jgi:putative heme iron utilization protein
MGFTARCLLRSTCWGTLATQRDGQPAAALVTHAVTADGAVLILLSSMSDHSKDLAVEGRCALMVTGQPENLNWQTAPRLSLNGRASRLTDPAAKRFWVARHPYARLYADFADFSAWRIVPESGLFIAGFGQINRLGAAQLSCPPAHVAALAAAQDTILEQARGSQANALNRLAHDRGHGGRWTMLSVDPDGFDLAQDETVLRIAFPAPVQDAAGVSAALRQMIG